MTAVAFRGIALQARGKSLKGVNSEMVESTAAGLLPKKTSRGGAPWQEYSRPFNKDVKRPRVAIILRGIGLSRRCLFFRYLGPLGIPWTFAGGRPVRRRCCQGCCQTE